MIDEKLPILEVWLHPEKELGTARGKRQGVRGRRSLKRCKREGGSPSRNFYKGEKK